MLYARTINLRNCGRFTVVASDFGSDYRTHTHVTSEALYAGLTRGVTWRPRLIDLKEDLETFTLTYDVEAMPIWFLPGTFVAERSHRLPDAALDTTAFNVVHEFYPSTSKRYVFKKSVLEERDRPYHVPTYGIIQAVKPDQRVQTCAFSPRKNLLETFAEGQTFLLGKKRTMFQIVSVTPVVRGEEGKGVCRAGWLELPPDYGGRFKSFEVLAATMRYVILRGTTREPVRYVAFQFASPLYLPDFYLDRTPLGVENIL
ncbi:MAG: hypothetical protein JRI33_00595 [Deltaproteobacteria bacterium]|nr:hypothetical protein [Deltaproteobacteria bacterium]